MQDQELSIKRKEISFDEDEKLRESSLKEIKCLLFDENNGNDSICNFFENDLLIKYFLRCTKYNLERAKDRIETFSKIRLKCPEWYDNRDPFSPEIAELLSLGVFLPLEKKDDQNRQVVVVRTGAHKPKKHSQNNVFKVSKMILDLLLLIDENISYYGICAIFDMSGVTLSHALALQPGIIKRSVESWQVYPCKVKLLEFVNAPVHVNFVLNTFRFFMTPKMKSRVIVRSSTSELNTELPKELGGTGKSYAELAEHWKGLVESNSHLFNKPKEES